MTQRSILPGTRWGEVTVPPSKSLLQRALILAALSPGKTVITPPGPLSQDVAATVRCLVALGATVQKTEEGLAVYPIQPEKNTAAADLYCGESGATLRFLLPLCGALCGASCRTAVFHREGSLPSRPLQPLVKTLSDHGMTVSVEGERLTVSGGLRPGRYLLPGNVSSQFFSGLLFALPLLPGDSDLLFTDPPESRPYIDMTLSVLQAGGIRILPRADGWHIPGGQRPAAPSRFSVEGDYSAAAPFLCAGALSRRGILCRGLTRESRQGDSAILSLLSDFGAEVTWEENAVLVRRGRCKSFSADASVTPDLIPALAVLAAAAEGASVFPAAGRLRLKESDRLAAVAALLTALGGKTETKNDTLTVTGQPTLPGGAADSFGDHRIAMAAALAAVLSAAPVTLRNPSCVAKSYPDFWRDFDALQLEKKERENRNI